MPVTDDAGAVLAQPNQNQSEADPGGIANTTSAPNATAPSAPDTSNLPAARTIDQTRAASGIKAKSPQQAAQEAVAADVGHHALFGRAVKNLVHSLNGTQSSYQANPQTGRIEEVSVPAKPGQFFRNLLSGMLIGASAGAQTPTDKEGRPLPGGSSFAQGFGRGIGAQTGYRQQQDQQRYARAQQDLKDQMEREKLTSEEGMHKAYAAHLNQETAGLEQSMHHTSQEIIDKRNAASRAFIKTMTDRGGVPATFNVGGRTTDVLSGSEFAKAYIADPRIAQGPEGSERHFISLGDSSELFWDGQQWRTEGGDVATPNSEIRAIDVPTNTMKTYRPVPNKQLEKIFGLDPGTLGPPDKSTNVNGEGLIVGHTNRVKNDGVKARAEGAKLKADQRNKNARIFTQIESKKASALASAEHNFWAAVNKSANPKEPDPELVSQLNTAKQNAQDAYEAEIKAAGGSAQHFEYGTAPAPQAKPLPRGNRQAPKVFSPSKWQAANPNGDVNAAIAEAKRQGMTVR